MFPTCRDIIQSNPMMVKVGVHVAIIFREELQDDSKATAKYCSAIRGAKRMKKLSAEEERAGLAISTSNSVSESLHGASTYLLQVFGTISVPHTAAMGQSHTNNNHSRAHNNLVTGQTSKKTIYSKKGACLEVTAKHFYPELCQSLTAASREYTPKHKKNMEKCLRWQFEARQRNEQTKVEMESAKLEREMLLICIFYQSNSPRLWKTVKEAR